MYCLHQHFEKQVETRPEATAVTFNDQSLTYAQLNQRANQLAHTLQKQGVGSEDLVAIYLDRSLEIIIAILGILKAGGAYVPLDPTYPPRRLAMMLEDMSAPFILTKQHLVSSLQDLNGLQSNQKIICLDSDWDQIALESVENPRYETDTNGLAYVLFTSGSTGRPKGVAVKHAGVINLLQDFEERQPTLPGEHCSWWTSINFDVSVYEIFTPLLAGGNLHIVPESVRGDGIALLKWMQQKNIQSAYIPPFMVSDFENWLTQTPEPLDMRRLLVGVEPINEQKLANISRRVPSLHIINGYGPTEATICCTLYSVFPDKAENRNTPIGKAVKNMQIYLLDADMQPVANGEPGEIYVGGIGLAQGYLNRDELTAARFVPNPFDSDKASRLYSTGDLARTLPDGNLLFIGRSDHQVKVRGYRIELGEIDAVLNQHAAVKNSVTVVLAGKSEADRRIVSYIASNSVPKLTVSDLRPFVQKHLPDYMVPATFVILDALPLTPSGKIDRQALPQPDRSRPELNQPYVAPRNKVEKWLAGMWQELLELDKVGVQDRFFELGGDSLRAALFMKQIEDELNVTLPAVTIFHAFSIEKFAATLEQDHRAALAQKLNLRAGRRPPQNGTTARQNRLDRRKQFDNRRRSTRTRG